MPNVFVTGGAGLIGSHTTRQLLDQGYEVTAFDSFQQYSVPHSSTFQENLDYRWTHLLRGAHVIRGSTENKDLLRRHLVHSNPQYVIHLAALPLAGAAVNDPEDALATIVRGTMNVLDVARDLPNLEKFVYVSSSMAYGNFVTTPVPEHAPKDPIDIYGAMKLAGEVMLRAYGRQYGIPYVIIRPSAVYGPSDNNKRVVQLLVERAARGEALTLDDPEKTYLDFTYVSDIANGLCLATLAPAAVGEDFNITCGNARSLTDLAEAIRVHFPDLRVTVGPRTENFRPVRGTLDVSKAGRLLGYHAKFPLEDGLAGYVEYMRSRNPSLFGSRNKRLGK